MTTMSPPISPQPQDGRPRAQTSMSYTSQRSRRSSSSGHKLELTESAKDKKRLNTKADPSRALNEATPAEQAQEQSTVDDLRTMMHKDNDGNVITDPDRSNPTRHRMERPLDTIRSFNEAAEGTSSRRSSYSTRPPSQVGWNNDMNRRGSYYSSNNGYSPQRPRATPGGGYYRNSSYGFGPQNPVEEEPGSAQVYGRGMRQTPNPAYGNQNGHHNGYANGHQNGYSNGPQNGYSNGYQNAHPGQYQNNESPMSAHSYQHSYETMTSGSEEYGKSTNPSSQNSSFDQLHQLRKPDDYGSANPYANEIQFNQVSPTKPFNSQYMQDSSYGPDAVQAPLPPPKAYPDNKPRQPINLNKPPNGSDFDERPAPPAKRQSWIKRKLSRREN